MVVENSDESLFNPGEFFQFYLSFLPSKATKDHLDGGWLFPRPRKHGQESLNIHKAGEFGLFEPNMKGKLCSFLLSFFLIYRARLVNSSINIL